MTMHTPLRSLRWCFFACLAGLFCLTAAAQTAAPAAPTTDERLAALEAYVNNGDPGKALTGLATNTVVPISAHVTNGVVTWTSP